MKNKTNEANKYECVLCETGETIRKVDLLEYIRKTSKTKAYVKEQKSIGEDPDSQWDSGYDSALDSIRGFIGD